VKGSGRRLEGKEGGRFNFHLEVPGSVAAVARIIRGMIGERMSTQDQDISALFYSLGWSRERGLDKGKSRESKCKGGRLLSVNFAVILLLMLVEWDPMTYLGLTPDPIQLGYRVH
jgi:hypothetical protein